MKTFVRHAVMALAVTVACQAGLALAEEFYWVSGDQAAKSEKAATPAQSACACNPSCCEESCMSGCGTCGELGCDECPCRGIVGFAGFDSFKGISDGEHLSNFGGVAGVNSALPVPGLSDYGIAWQLGMSYGVYDLDGRVEANNPAQIQQQVFVTTGFFRKAADDQRVSLGVVYDWMINNNWGVYETAPTLGQWRAQVEYALSGCNAIGLWGCITDLNSSQAVTHVQTRITVRSRPVSQANLFWHHKFCTGADSWLWLGFPQQGRLDDDGSLGAWMVGATLQAPLSDRLALYANGSYFRPSAAAGEVAAVEAGYDVSVGVAWYFGRHAISHSINGACWLPYMPMANNSNFLVDQAYTAVR